MRKSKRLQFQFTPLREGRRHTEVEMEVHSNFNSRPSARGDRRSPFTLPTKIQFQFTPLREGRPSARVHADFRRISIHAPPRGATKGVMDEPRSRMISIHAPPRGATRVARLSCRALRYFNSRPSARGDGKRYAISANLLFNPYKSAWLNNRATQFVEIILVIFHRIIA